MYNLNLTSGTKTKLQLAQRKIHSILFLNDERNPVFMPQIRVCSLEVFFFSTKTYVVGTQKNHFNETVLLSAQNVC